MYGRKKQQNSMGIKVFKPHVYFTGVASIGTWRIFIVLQFNGGHNSHTVERNLFAQKKMRIWEV